MKENTLDIKTVHQCNCCLGCKTLHPQVSIVNLDKTNLEQNAVKFDLYTILLIEGDADKSLCGRKYCDYSNATLVFLTPGESFRLDDKKIFPDKGWLLTFHPDLLYRTALNNHIKNYTFFFYRKEEALHLSIREKDKVVECLEDIEEELRHAIDRHSKTLISRYIELLLDYCSRFYERQFITREEKNKAVLYKLDRLLDDYISSGELRKGNLPSSLYCAEKLSLSPLYFDDLLIFETGRNLYEYFQSKRLDVSRKMLLEVNHTANDVARELGFPNVLQFKMIFKKLTGIAPDEYRTSRN